MSKTPSLIERLQFTAEHGLFASVQEGKHASYQEAADTVAELLEALRAARIALIAIADSAVEAGFDQLGDIIDEQLGKANSAIDRATGAA
jgi:methionine synthase II (cobalamin-independent)